MSDTQLPAFLPDPLKQLQLWYESAVANAELHADAITLATATREGRPSARIVLYKGIDPQGGIVIYTNYQSRKAVEMTENPYAALVFYWASLYQQVRVEGVIERISKEESQRYFATRPYESQIGAWISPQSKAIPDREYLLKRYDECHKKFPVGQAIVCPEFWGGFRLIPDNIEFWIGRPHRLHDRFLYRKRDAKWEVVRLAP